MDKKNGLIVSWKRTNEIIASIYIVAILAIFPLVFNNYYYDILRAVSYTHLNINPHIEQSQNLIPIF